MGESVKKKTMIIALMAIALGMGSFSFKLGKDYSLYYYVNRHHDLDRSTGFINGNLAIYRWVQKEFGIVKKKEDSESYRVKDTTIIITSDGGQKTLRALE